MKTIENVMSQGAMTISYFNIYIEGEELTLLPLDSGAMQAMAKFGGVVTSVGAVAFGDFQRHRLVKDLREMKYNQIKEIEGAITVPIKEMEVKKGILRSMLKVKGKRLRIKNKVINEILLDQAK